MTLTPEQIEAERLAFKKYPGTSLLAKSQRVAFCQGLLTRARQDSAEFAQVKTERDDYRDDSLRLLKNKMDCLDRALAAEARIIALEEQIRAAVEACAKVAEKHGHWDLNNPVFGNVNRGRNDAARMIAAAIRARSVLASKESQHG